LNLIKRIEKGLQKYANELTDFNPRFPNDSKNHTALGKSLRQAKLKARNQRMSIQKSIDIKNKILK